MLFLLTRSQKLIDNLASLVNWLNLLGFSKSVGTKNFNKQFANIHQKFKGDSLVAKSKDNLFCCEFFKDLLDDYLKEDTEINRELRVWVAKSKDPLILDALLRQMHIKRSMPEEAVVKRYSKEISSFIKSKLSTQQGFVFVVKFMNLLGMFNLARISLTRTNAGSCSIKQLIIENMVTNNAWSGLSDEPGMFDFLYWLLEEIKN